MKSRTALFALFVTVWASTGSAQRIVHRASFGDTLEAIALKYYGDKTRAWILRETNRDVQKQKLNAGHRIRVPTAWIFIAQSRTTASAIAVRALGSTRGTAAIRYFNRDKVDGKGRIRAGAALIIPFDIATKIDSASTTFKQLAKKYYGYEGASDMLRAHNGGGDPSAGREIRIPIGNVRIRGTVMRTLINQRLLGVASSGDNADRAALQEANGMIRRGAYSRVPLRLIRAIARESPSDSHIAEVFKLLAIAYVALDEPSLAERAFAEALLRKPDLRLDPVTVSPKVIKAFVNAKQPARR